jgi:hypothetical protein
VVAFGIGRSMLGVGWPPANTVALSHVRTNWPVILGWMSRLPDSPASPPGSRRYRIRTLPAACHAADLVAADVVPDRVAGSIEDLGVADLDRSDVHAGDARGQAAAQRLYLG